MSATMETLPKVNSTTWADEVEAEEAAFGQGEYLRCLYIVVGCVYSPQVKDLVTRFPLPASCGGGVSTVSDDVSKGIK